MSGTAEEWIAELGRPYWDDKPTAQASVRVLVGERDTAREEAARLRAALRTAHGALCHGHLDVVDMVISAALASSPSPETRDEAIAKCIRREWPDCNQEGCGQPCGPNAETLLTAAQEREAFGEAG